MDLKSLIRPASLLAGHLLPSGEGLLFHFEGGAKYQVSAFGIQLCSSLKEISEIQYGKCRQILGQQQDHGDVRPETEVVVLPRLLSTSGGNPNPVSSVTFHCA